MFEPKKNKVVVEHISELHEVMGLPCSDPTLLKDIYPCPESEKDYERLISEDETFIPHLSHMLVQLDRLDRQPAVFHRPDIFECPIENALLMRSPQDAFDGQRVIELTLYPILTGAIISSIDAHLFSMPTGHLYQKRFNRMHCWRENFPYVRPPRRDPFDELHK